MAIGIVQSVAIGGAWSGSFGSNVGAGNTVYLFGYQYTTAGAAMSSSGPQFNGAAVGSATQLISGQGPGTDTVYGTVWQLPDLAGGAASFALTPSGGTVDSNVGIIALEVSGMGTTPALDAGATPNPSPGSGNSAAVSSGTTGAITSSPELILGLGAQFGGVLTLPGAPWGGLLTPSGFCAAGWQVAASSGGTYAYAPATSVTESWYASVAALEPAGSAGITAAGGLAMAGMAWHGTAAERFTAAGGLAMAPMAWHGTATQTGSNITATGGLKMAPMAWHGSGPSIAVPNASPDDDWHRVFRRRRRMGRWTR
jgi:hypothetical protein